MSAREWGRVDADGTVWVRTSDGERAVGSYPGASEEAALAYFGQSSTTYAQVDRSSSGAPAGVPERCSEPGRFTDANRRRTRSVTSTGRAGERAGAAGRGARARSSSRAGRRGSARFASRTALVEEAEALAEQDPDRSWRTAGDRRCELFEIWRAPARQLTDKH